jgi:hypothetical protein
MNHRFGAPVSGWMRATRLATLLAFVAGSQHCVLTGLAGRTCDAAPAVAIAPAAPAVAAEHDCCAPRSGRAPEAPKPDSRPACCIDPAPLPASATVSAPAPAATPLAVPAPPAAPDAAAPRGFARPPERGSPPVRPAPAPSLGRAPPLA